MSLSFTVQRGKTMVAGVKWSVDDWNVALTPVIVPSGSIGASDIADDSITFTHLNPNFILGGTVIEDLDSADKLLIGQAATSDNKVITFQHFLRSIVRECDEVDTFADYYADRVIFFRHSDDLPVTMGLGRFFEQSIEQAPIEEFTNQDDVVPIRRTSQTDGLQFAQVSLRNLLPSIVSAQTVNNPTQIVIDAKGRVTSLSGTEGASDFTTSGIAVPVQTVLGTVVGTTPVAHGLGSGIRELDAVLTCTTIDAGWQVGDVIELSRVLWQPGGGSTLTIFALTPYADATNVGVLANCTAAEMQIQSKSTGSFAAFTPGRWTLSIRVSK